MIRQIKLTNYGPFACAELELEPLTVVVGPNASGKSKLLELMAFVGSTSNSDSLYTFFRKRRRKGAGDSDMTVSLVAAGDEVGTTLEWKPELQVHGLEGDFDLSIDHLSAGKARFRGIALQMSPELLRTPSYLDSNEPMMYENGYGIATTLAYLKLNDTNSYNLLLEHVRKIVPTFEGLHFKRSLVKRENKESVYGDELTFDMTGAPELTMDAVSDGTLLTLGLLTYTMECARRHDVEHTSLLFLIDDLERGLHPRALAELVSQLRRLTETSDVQILATSHSPYLLDSLKPEEVRLTGFLDDGSTTIRPLTDHPDFQRWKDEMTPGELWSLVGEDWVK